MTTLAELLDTSTHSPDQRRATELARSDYQLKADLVAERLKAGLTQADVASRLGVTQPTIASFERHDSDPKLSTIRRYAHAIGALVGHSVRKDAGDLADGHVWSTVLVQVEVSGGAGSSRDVTKSYRTMAANNTQWSFALAA
jgi:transcriptional regulator with XRE-family HTH domain